jgi:hypothetical protein
MNKLEFAIMLKEMNGGARRLRCCVKMQEDSMEKANADLAAKRDMSCKDCIKNEYKNK